MLATTETLLDAGLGARVFSSRDVARVFGGTPARRHALVHKAMAAGELVRLKRGIYVLGPKYRTAPMSEHHVASCIVPMSYVSFESALAFHGWIPEAVATVRSARCHGRSESLETELGLFTYTKVPVARLACLVGVARREVNGLPFLLADPLRALADQVHVAKVEWSGVAYLLDGLRIDRDDLEELSSEDFDAAESVYRGRRVRGFLAALRQELER